MTQKSKHPIRMHNLPPQFTSFIGRAEEVAEITELLADPACRLVTLVGAGGIGKTRLSIQVATQVLDDFTHGVYFVPLQSIETTDFLVSAVTDAINLALRGQDTPQDQLLNYLSDKETLLVLDNFEHLLAPSTRHNRGGETFLTETLELAPAVKLLVTSREVLNLQGEWLYTVSGLSFPPSSQADNVELYSAVQLFVDRARRMRRDFSLIDEQADVIRICQLVEGMPLAIELAAPWTRTMGCAEIAAEIQRNIDFLTSSLRDVPDRQRNMRAIFDQSWKLLTEEERSVFKRLSVFRGGFQRAAAKWVASASLSTLSSLVDKSLLRSEPGGRYQIHELLRQYAAEQLVQSPDDVAEVYDLHCTYYANFLYERSEDILRGQQREVTVEIKAELENIRAA